MTLSEELRNIVSGLRSLQSDARSFGSAANVPAEALMEVNRRLSSLEADVSLLKQLTFARTREEQ